MMVADHQVYKYLCTCGVGSKVHKNIFVANLHCITSKAHFQKWRATYPCAIPDDVHVKLAASSTDNEPCVDPNDPDAKIITFCPFYFSLGFMFSLSKFFRKLFCPIECAPSQCAPNAYQAIMCFRNPSCFFKLDLTVQEFFYFSEVKHYEKSTDGGKARMAMVHLFLSLFTMNDISKKLDLKPNMAKTQMIYPLNGEVLDRTPRMELQLCRQKDVSPLRKKPKLPSTTIKSSLKKVSYAKKTQVGATLSSSAKVKHLVGSNNKKIRSMRNVQDILDEDRTGRIARSPNHHDSSVKPRAWSRFGVVDSFEASPKVDKSNCTEDMICSRGNVPSCPEI
ncbi:unnamed protein product [Prunus armeniaca]